MAAQSTASLLYSSTVRNHAQWLDTLLDHDSVVTWLVAGMPGVPGSWQMHVVLRTDNLSHTNQVGTE